MGVEIPVDAIRLSSRSVIWKRWALPIGFVALAGVLIVLAEIDSEDRGGMFLLLGAALVYVLYQWNFLMRAAEVWVKGDQTYVQTLNGTVCLELDEIKRVWIAKEMVHHERGGGLVHLYTVRLWDVVEIEFERMTEIGSRVRFVLPRRPASGRRDRDRHFTAWMKEVNRSRTPHLARRDRATD